MRIKKIVIILLIFFLLPTFSCNSKRESTDSSNYDDFDSLETYFNKPLNKYMMKQLANSFSNDEDYYEVKIEVEENRMIYKCYSKENLGTDEFTESIFKSYFSSNKESLFNDLRSTINIDENYEIEFIIYNKDYTKAADVVLYENEEEQNNTIDELDTDDSIAETDSLNFEPECLQDCFDTMIGDGEYEDLEIIKQNNADVFSNITVVCFDNTISYNFYFIEDMGDVQNNVNQNLNKEEQEYIINSIKSYFEYKNQITVIYTYYNPDGSIAAEIKFEG